jgi:cyclohexa-1,5-dienecarbonyl-CoA hydratase
MLSIETNRDESRTTLRFSHPKGNIITAELIASLSDAIDDAGTNPHLKLLALEGDGADFSFGASIPEHAPDEIGRVLPAMHALITKLLDVPAPTAAFVRGRCLGGGFELAMACDFIFATEDAVFGLPEIALGVFPPAACALLPQKVGWARATSAILTGDSRPAGEWRDAGLVEFVVDAASLHAEVDRWFDLHIAARSAAALRHATAAARFGLKTAVTPVLGQVERIYLKDLMRTADAAEGIRAFLEKRPPRWSDS